VLSTVALVWPPTLLSDVVTAAARLTVPPPEPDRLTATAVMVLVTFDVSSAVTFTAPLASTVTFATRASTTLVVLFTAIAPAPEPASEKPPLPLPVTTAPPAMPPEMLPEAVTDAATANVVAPSDVSLVASISTPPPVTVSAEFWTPPLTAVPTLLVETATAPAPAEEHAAAGRHGDRGGPRRRVDRGGVLGLDDRGALGRDPLAAGGVAVADQGLDRAVDGVGVADDGGERIRVVQEEPGERIELHRVGVVGVVLRRRRGHQVQRPLVGVEEDRLLFHLRVGGWTRTSARRLASSRTPSAVVFFWADSPKYSTRSWAGLTPCSTR
jgi:hypothetical protein